MVAIVKAIAFDAKVIIMDEPTSAITDREVEQLFQVIEKLKNQGKAIVYISHKMDEIFRIADVITIMRDGKHIIWIEKAGFWNDRGPGKNGVYEKPTDGDQ